MMSVPYLQVIVDCHLPSAGNLHLLVADASALMADEAAQLQAMAMLSTQRREKATACAHVRPRVLSIGVGLLLDALLQEAGLREREQTYTENAHGKPALAAHPNLHFNLSHSGSIVAAVIGKRPAGVDVQHITRYRPEVVRRMFTPDDRQQLGTCTTEEERKRLFAQLWCRAEAYAKATGIGLLWPFPVPPPEATFHDFEAGTDYVGCVCMMEG